MKLTIGKKLILVGVLGSVIPLLGIGAVALWQGSKSRTTAEHECTKLACADLDHILEGVHGMLVCQKEVLEQKVTGDLNVASNELAIAGGMSLGTDTVRWESRNQLTESSQTVELPVMQLGDLLAPSVYHDYGVCGSQPVHGADKVFKKFLVLDLVAADLQYQQGLCGCAHRPLPGTPVSAAP